MFQNFNHILQRMNLLQTDKQILLAVSGGVDSIVLLKLMQNIPVSKRPELSIAHINHQLRPEANDEEEFVKKLAKNYQIPFYTYCWPKSQHPKNGIEEAARNVRYTFFKKIMTEQNMDVVMTAHHQDDQVETILMKLTRGSILEQLTGIDESQSFAEGKLVRPLLNIPKEDLIAFAKDQQLEFMEDDSNFEPTYTRNRFRNQIIPLLQQENNQFNQHIEQFAADLKDLLEISNQPIQELFDRLVNDEDGALILDIEEYTKLSPAYQRLLLKHLLNNLFQYEENGYKTTYIEIIQDWLIYGEVNTTLDLQSDFIAQKGYDTVSFLKKTAEIEEPNNSEAVLWNVNEWVQLSSTEKIGLFVFEENEVMTDELWENTLLISEENLKMPLRVRHRKPGDRMQYAGLGGSKKIKDIFIDDKTPADDRDQAWLVEDQTGDILWLISYRKMNLFTVQETDKLTYILKYKTY